MKVLVAEDDCDQLAIRCMLLTRSGFEALPAGDVATALQLATASKPECALVDLRFPSQSDGLTLVRELKKIAPQMYVVVLTGLDSSRSRALSDLELADQIFVKGAPIQELLATLKAACERSSTH